MKTIYLECNMGAAGDMLMSALYELLPNKKAFLDNLNSLIPGVQVKAEKALTCGVAGTRMEVHIAGALENSADIPLGALKASEHEHEHGHEHEHEHVHQHCHVHPGDVFALIKGLALPDPVKEKALYVYERLADAESQVHDVPVTQIHLHEVGTLDAVIDIVGVCLAFYMLSPDEIRISPIHLGSGQVRCAHGILPVPTPATAHLLRGIPCYGGEIRGELCTPTGAALIKTFGGSFGPMPIMTLTAVGCGVGKKEFPVANCVRVFWGETTRKNSAEIVELCCHIDDMSAEALAFASEQLMASGALDVSSAPISMKKGRLGVALTVLCRVEDEESAAEAILRQTNTNGVRARLCRKYILEPSLKTLETSYGPVQIKCGDGYGIHHEKPEYQSVAAIARERGLPFQPVWEEVVAQLKEEDMKEK